MCSCKLPDGFAGASTGSGDEPADPGRAWQKYLNEDTAIEADADSGRRHIDAVSATGVFHDDVGRADAACVSRHS